MQLEVYGTKVTLNDEFYLDLSPEEEAGLLAYLKLLKAAQAVKEILK